MEFHIGPADLDARMTLTGTLGSVETKPRVVLRRLLGVDRVERDVVEVVLDLGRRLDDSEPQRMLQPKSECRLVKDSTRLLPAVVTALFTMCCRDWLEKTQR